MGIWPGESAYAEAPEGTSVRSLAPGDHDLTITYSDFLRRYLLHVPPQAKEQKPLPVVLAFHGGGGRGEGQKVWSGLDAIADREGFLAVYPDGAGCFGRRLLTWNAGFCCDFASDHKVDDVGFVVAPLTDLAQRTSVDHTRVYATGMSNGAMMSYRLATEIPERIATAVQRHQKLEQQSTGKKQDWIRLTQQRKSSTDHTGMEQKWCCGN